MRINGILKWLLEDDWGIQWLCEDNGNIEVVFRG